MTISKPPDWSSGQWIALYGFTVAALLSWGVFILSRNDHDMKLLALGAVISTSSTLIGTASTILVGKTNPATGNHDLTSLPGGSIATDSTTVQLPPLSTPPSPIEPPVA